MTVFPQPSACAIMPHIHEWWSDRCQESWDAEVLAILDIVSLDAIAGRHGLSRAGLIEIAERDPSSCSEMIRMMHALNIDPVEAADEPEFAEMARNCAGCPDKGRCRKHLAAGTAAAHLDAFCVNADALNAMRATPHLLDRV
ncbi:DUF6455 family protein [Rhizobiaceae bacterium BDR2-2]|uniref:DUF6455 family protein n=1 Tax=Ectorhizobium quercum TaxID=2965071 RepID=A0AAE3SW95_9HYPH|nr:DUF6455 family protein [Ectorhizobium quercum]MCX8998947.1 DUF6455 family protein [Ectorhizobium quercum]